jgi:excisionase family DNA binding protein
MRQGRMPMPSNQEGKMAERETRPTIMTLEEVAKYLRLHKSTVYRMAREGKLPGNKVAGQWRFKKDRLVAWFEEQQRLQEEALD